MKTIFLLFKNLNLKIFFIKRNIRQLTSATISQQKNW